MIGQMRGSLVFYPELQGHIAVVITCRGCLPICGRVLFQMIKDPKSYLRTAFILIAACDSDGLTSFYPVSRIYEDAAVPKYFVAPKGAVAVGDLHVILSFCIGITGIRQDCIGTCFRYTAATGCINGISAMDAKIEAIPVLGWRDHGLVAKLFGQEIEFVDMGFPAGRYGKQIGVGCIHSCMGEITFVIFETMGNVNAYSLCDHAQRNHASCTGRNVHLIRDRHVRVQVLKTWEAELDDVVAECVVMAGEYVFAHGIPFVGDGYLVVSVLDVPSSFGHKVCFSFLLMDVGFSHTLRETGCAENQHS